MTRIPSDHEHEPAGGDGEPQSLSLMSGVAGGASNGLSEADLMAVDSAGGSRISHSTMVLIGVAVIAAASLYLMRMTQGELAGAASSDVEVKIEQALAKLTQPQTLREDDPLQKDKLEALFSDTDTIVSMFASDLSETHQVPVEYVKKNPFQLPTVETAGPVAVVDTSARDLARRTAALQKSLDKLSLQTVMVSGKRRVAVIDGEFYQPGETVGDFTVVSMDTMSVQLEAAGHPFELTLEDR